MVIGLRHRAYLRLLIAHATIALQNVQRRKNRHYHHVALESWMINARHVRAIIIYVCPVLSCPEPVRKGKSMPRDEKLCTKSLGLESYFFFPVAICLFHHGKENLKRASASYPLRLRVKQKKL